MVDSAAGLSTGVPEDLAIDSTGAGLMMEGAKMPLAPLARDGHTSELEQTQTGDSFLIALQWVVTLVRWVVF